MSLHPIITICGTTGVGKSKLAVELATYLNKSAPIAGWRGAKIINADAMQVYKGLDVITNKMPENERQGIDHLLLGFKDPGGQYVVGDWVKDASKLIGELHRNHQLPIVVGGTSYWIQHLLFPSRLLEKNQEDGHIAPQSEHLAKSIQTLPPDLLDLFNNLPQVPPSAKTHPDDAFKLHQLLSSLDPTISRRWHWKDTRKVLRSLAIVKETGRCPSEIISEQAKDNQEIQPRFKALSFWLYADLAILGERLDARVDDMISQGLLDEVRCLRDMAGTVPTTPPLDFTLGIYQSIGYKEFCAYLDAPSDASFKEAEERMKISTRQYAKRQISWLRNKLIPAIDTANAIERQIPLYILDATVLGDKWTTNVQTPAQSILNAFLVGDPLPEPIDLSQTANRVLTTKSKSINPQQVLEARVKRVCPVCTLQSDRPVMIEEGEEWLLHQRTKVHRKLAARQIFTDPNP
ncbi:tRNA isopentenyltransferase [Panaeolus papilionaceus]|nr:tRNA isopentenyltransferase [Panaeolus papilionaceus]